MDPLGLDTYQINNEFGSSEPTGDLVSHTYIATTNKDPSTGKETVTNTYSWGNDGKSQWFENDPQNMKGAQNAVDSGKGSYRKGNEKMDKYVEKAYQKRKDDTTEYNLTFNNCKQNGCELLGDALLEWIEDKRNKKEPCK